MDPHSARIWNYWLGGKDNYAIDQRVGDEILQIFPEVGYLARAVRAFRGRVVTYLVNEAGIRQVIDIGTGLPTVNNTHEVAQQIAPECRIVYVDNDPLVLAHARALLTSTAEGLTDYIDADARDTDKIRSRAALTLDFDKPIAITMLGILGHISDYAEARAIVNQLLDAVPPGSYLAITDPTHGEKMDALLRHWNEFGRPSMIARIPCTLLRMQRERLTVSMHPQTVALVRQCGARTRGGASGYLEHLVRQDALREAAASAASWYAAHPTYAADSEVETMAALDETA